MATKYPDSVDKRSMENGLEFQDFVADQLFEHGLFVQYYASRRYQYERGESRQGVEIKFDSWCTKSQRLSIETAEKTRIDGPWSPSGIYRKDNTWLYVQGNYEVFFIFSKTQLQSLHVWENPDGSLRLERKEEPTVRAFYMPFEVAERWALKVIRSKRTR